MWFRFCKTHKAKFSIFRPMFLLLNALLLRAILYFCHQWYFTDSKNIFQVRFSERRNFREQEEKIRLVFDNLTQLDHPNIVKLHKYWIDSKNDKPRVCIMQPKPCRFFFLNRKGYALLFMGIFWIVCVLNIVRSKAEFPSHRLSSSLSTCHQDH